MSHNDLLEIVVLGEIEGKNRAIHAYDDLVWKVRSGFLTLLFGGWAILLNGITEAKADAPHSYTATVWALFLFSLGFSFGAWYIDRSYVRRKFRVIFALDRLTDAVRACNGDYHTVPAELLKVAGDNADMPYDSQGYQEAVRAELTVYLVPAAILVAAVVLLLV